MNYYEIVGYEMPALVYEPLGYYINELHKGLISIDENVSENGS